MSAEHSPDATPNQCAGPCRQPCKGNPTCHACHVEAANAAAHEEARRAAEVTRATVAERERDEAQARLRDIEATLKGEEPPQDNALAREVFSLLGNWSTLLHTCAGVTSALDGRGEGLPVVKRVQRLMEALAQSEANERHLQGKLDREIARRATIRDVLGAAPDADLVAEVVRLREHSARMQDERDNWRSRAMDLRDREEVAQPPRAPSRSASPRCAGWCESAASGATTRGVAALGAQPAPSGGTGDCWAELIPYAPPAIRDLCEARRAEGIQRYGVPLGRGDRRDAERDLREELLDAAVYAQRLQGETDCPSALALHLLEIARGASVPECSDCLAAENALTGAAPEEGERGRALEVWQRIPLALAAARGWSARELAVWDAVLDDLEAAEMHTSRRVVAALVGVTRG